MYDDANTTDVNVTAHNYTASTRPSARGGRRSGGPSDVDYYWVWVYVSPWILLIGVVGNILTLAVMTRRRLRGSSTCVYLSAMAVADSLALLFRIPPEFFEAARIFTFKNLSRLAALMNKGVKKWTKSIILIFWM